MSENHILIVGAGIAGLASAYQLEEKFKVTIVEATDRVGGRIHTLDYPGFSTTIEAGAEFIHGNAQHTYDLLRDAGLTYTKVEGEFYRKTDGVLKIQDEMVAGWDQLIEQMGNLEDDVALNSFLMDHFPGAEYAVLRNQAQTYAGGFDLADPEKVSAKTLYNEWSDEHPEYRVDGGYQLLVDFLESACRKKGCTFILNTAVREISWDAGSVRLLTTNAGAITAAKCIITLPLSLLQNEHQSLTFQPDIPAYRNAFRQIGYGTVVKAVFEFKSAFWKEDMGFVFDEQPFPTWWTQAPNDNLTLTGWAGAAHAAALQGLSEEEILKIAIVSIAAIFDISELEIKNNIQAARIFNWSENRYSKGAYSYATPATSSARALLSLPIAHTLYFCGEAIYDGPDQGTVEAAITSGYAVAALILSSVES